MKRWVDIIGYEPVEPEQSIDTSQPTLVCCNCSELLIICNVWSKCEKCNFYNSCNAKK
jgi:hypothetical protein